MTATDIAPSPRTAPCPRTAYLPGGLPHARFRYRRVRLDRLGRRPRAHRRGPSGHRARPLGRLGRGPHRGRGRGGTRHHRRSRRPAERGGRLGRRHPPRVQARHRILGRLPGRGRRGSPRHRDVRRGAGGFRQAVRHRLRDARARTGTGGDRTGRAGRRPGGGGADRRPGGPARQCAPDALAGRPRRPLVRAAPPADRARRRRQRFHGGHRRHRPRQGGLRLSRRRVQPLARRAPARRRAPLPCWRWRRPRRDRCCMRSPTRACRSATSPA